MFLSLTSIEKNLKWHTAEVLTSKSIQLEEKIRITYFS